MRKFSSKPEQILGLGCDSATLLLLLCRCPSAETLITPECCTCDLKGKDANSHCVIFFFPIALCSIFLLVEAFCVEQVYVKTVRLHLIALIG